MYFGRTRAGQFTKSKLAIQLNLSVCYWLTSVSGIVCVRKISCYSLPLSHRLFVPCSVGRGVVVVAKMRPRAFTCQGIHFFIIIIINLVDNYIGIKVTQRVTLRLQIQLSPTKILSVSEV